MDLGHLESGLRGSKSLDLGFRVRIWPSRVWIWQSRVWNRASHVWTRVLKVWKDLVNLLVLLYSVGTWEFRVWIDVVFLLKLKKILTDSELSSPFNAVLWYFILKHHDW